MHRVQTLLGVGVASLLLLGGAASATAQDATPPAGIGEAIDPSECQAQRPPVDDLIALWYEDGATVSTPTAVNTIPDAVPAPLGEPADADTVAAVTALVRQVAACVNTGDFLRVYSFFSDDLQRQFGPEPGTTIEDARAFLDIPPETVTPENYWRVIAVTDVTVLEDGRVGAFIVSDQPGEAPEGIETEFLIFVEEDGAWALDAVLEFTQVDEEDEDES